MILTKPTAEIPVSANLPYAAFISPSILLNHNRDLVCTIKFNGISIETTVDEQINQFQQAFHSALNNLPGGVDIWVNIIRSKTTYDKLTPKGNGFANAFQKEYLKNLNQSGIFKNEYYISLLLKNNSDNVKAFKTIFDLINKKQSIDFKYKQTLKRAKRLEAICNQLMTSLDMYQPKLLGEKKQGTKSKSELLSFLSQILNLRKADFGFPAVSASETIPLNRMFFGRNTVQVLEESQNKSKYLAVGSFKRYGSLTLPSHLTPFLKLPQELIISHVYQPIAKEQAKEEIKRHQKKLFSVNDESESQVQEISIALDDLQADRVSFGYHTGMVTTASSDLDALESKFNEIQKVANNLELKLVRETLNIEPAYWSQFPGNTEFVFRKAMISSRNFCDFISLHNSEQGHFGRNHLNEPIIPLKTPSNEVFHFNFHAIGSQSNLSLGHTTLIGPSGAGKTTLLGAFDAFLRRFNAKSYILDYRKGMASYTKASDGEYFVLEQGVKTGINPIPQDDKPRSRQYLQEFIQALVIRDNEVLNAVDEAIIANAVSGVFKLPKSSRNLSTLASFFNPHWDKFERLHTWLESECGSRSYLFDTTSNDLNFNADVIGLDLTHIMQDNTALLPLMLYLFYKIESGFDGGLTSIILDEGWQFLSHPYWEKALSSWLATFRKENAFVVFATQNPHEVACSSLSYGLIQGAATNIYLSNQDAQKHDYQDAFNLNDREFELIKSINPLERHFLVKQAGTSGLAACNLAGMEEYISIFSGNQLSFGKIQALQKKFGKKAENWLPHYWKVNNEN